MTAPPRLPTPRLREAAELALNSGDVDGALEMATDLATRDNIGPWDKALLGRIAMASGDPADAVSWLTKARDDLPEEGAILLDLASAHAANKKWKTAAAVLEQAIAQRPDIIALHERHGTYLANAGDRGGALAALDRALALQPGHAGVLTQQGELYLAEGDVSEAKQRFETALVSESANRAALSNLALVQEREGNLSAALATLERYSATHPGPDADHRRGQVLLALGRLDEGWPLYARRLKSKAYKSWQHALRVPYWQGEDISNQHLVIWSDQGLGEQILTASLVSQAAEHAKAVTLACDPRLVSLFQRSFPEIAVVPLVAIRNRGEGIHEPEVQASLSELGVVLRPTLDAMPNPQPFLRADPVRVAEFKNALTQDGKQLIGISWRSANPQAGDAKSSDLSHDWRPILTMNGLKLVSLQYGNVESDLTLANGVIKTLPNLDFTKDVDSFAALVAAMDVVVSVSNTTVHVAGGLGVPTLAVVPKAYGRPWYWFEQGDGTPWYPEITLVRQTSSWAEALNRAASQLQERLS